MAVVQFNLKAKTKSKYAGYYNIKYLDIDMEDNNKNFNPRQFQSLEDNSGESKQEKEPETPRHINSGVIGGAEQMMSGTFGKDVSLAAITR